MFYKIKYLLMLNNFKFIFTLQNIILLQSNK